MNNRERFLALMNYKPVDRCIYGIPWGGMWGNTIDRWKGEGYKPEEEPLFPTDPWIWKGGWFYPNPPFERRIVSEDESTTLLFNELGELVRELKINPGASMPQFLKFPVETREDFRKIHAERMRPDLAARIGPNWIEELSSYKTRDCPFAVSANLWGGFFGPLRNLVGLERLCILFYDDPAFVEEMMDTTMEFMLAIIRQILDHTDIDIFGFWEDMAYKNGPLIGPEMVRKFMFPRYRRVVDLLHSKGVRWIALDCDGDMTSLIPIWLEAGINFLYPFEVQSGMDVVKARREFGKDLRMFGGIDKRTLVRGPAAIDVELQRLVPLIREGGYIPALDHSIPPDVSFANYCYYMNRLRSIL